MLFLVWIFLAVGVGAWATSYSRSFISWTLLSMVISPLLGAICLLVSGNGGKKCPSCAEYVQPEALKCKHCGTTFGKDAAATKEPDPFDIAC